ncbi:hypothetical protein NDU88_002203 [Pleurodeles waltl]|uniref:Uncharacterized protein n=1 Tax=Pleurodeles waltl TaxID=8319 RepID=A0AAV7WP76_PLEWA|nr:hypothetical protein NDU88_002202 [Pleurodeles waltl]KAJ1214585.1 hypothetical protein NDU88_002203 [Pleurodeles waltl]
MGEAKQRQAKISFDNGWWKGGVSAPQSGDLPADEGPSGTSALPGLGPNTFISPVGAAVSLLPLLSEPSAGLVLPVLAAPVGAFGSPAARSRVEGSACARPTAAGGVPLWGCLLVLGVACGGGGSAGRALVVVGSGVLFLQALLPATPWGVAPVCSRCQRIGQPPACRGALTAPWRPVSSAVDTGWGGCPGFVCWAGLRRCKGS